MLRRSLRSLWGEPAEQQAPPEASDPPGTMIPLPAGPVSAPASQALPESGVPPIDRIFITEHFVAAAGPGPSDVPEQVNRSRLIAILQALRISRPCDTKAELAKVSEALWSIDMERLTPEGRALRTEGLALFGITDEKVDSPEERARLLEIMANYPQGMPLLTMIDAHCVPPQTVDAAMRDGILGRSDFGYGLTRAHGGVW